MRLIQQLIPLIYLFVCLFVSDNPTLKLYIENLIEKLADFKENLVRILNEQSFPLCPALQFIGKTSVLSQIFDPNHVSKCQDFVVIVALLSRAFVQRFSVESWSQKFPKINWNTPARVGNFAGLTATLLKTNIIAGAFLCVLQKIGPFFFQNPSEKMLLHYVL